MVNIKSVWAAVHLIHIPSTRYYYVNNTMGLVLFDHLWPKSPKTEVLIQTVDDHARAEEYCRKRNAHVVDENAENKEETAEDKVEDDDEE